MNLQLAMIAGTFVLGIVVVVVGIVALWRSKAKGGEGSLKALGIEVSGNGAGLVLVVGAAFVLAGFGWAATHQEAETQKATVATRTNELKDASDAIAKYEEDKASLRSHLQAVLPPDKVRELEAKVPALTTHEPKWKASAETLNAIRSMRVVPPH